jgi:hypothetical protein
MHKKVLMVEKLNVSRPNVKDLVPTVEFENHVIHDLQEERLRQSRIIARQLDTIGRLNRALDQMRDRSFRRPFSDSIIINSPSSNSPFHEDASTQTDGLWLPTPSDTSAVRVALIRVNQVNEEYRERNECLEMELDTERGRIRRILTVCDRLMAATVPMSASSLARWIILGLEGFTSPSRERTNTYSGFCRDDASIQSTPLPMYRSPPLEIRDRDALSEGESPVDGFDLDIIFGSFEPNSMMARGSTPLSPRAAEAGDPVLLRALAGTYWTGAQTALLRFSPGTPLEGLWGDQPVTVTGSDNCVMVIFKSTNRSVEGVYFPETRTLRWLSGQVWSRVEDDVPLPGDWWTGFTVIHLFPARDLSGTAVGSWGLREVELRLVSNYENGSAVVEANLGGGLTMHGSLQHKYPDTPGSRSVIKWFNGQLWEQQTV